MTLIAGTLWVALSLVLTVCFTRLCQAVHFYLSDDTVEVVEKHAANNGRDPATVLVSRQRVPHSRAAPAGFPSSVMEVPPHEMGACISPADFCLGDFLVVNKRALFLYDCDEFTRKFYSDNFGLTDMAPVAVTVAAPPTPRAPVPPHIGFGTPEDSLKSVLSLNPKPNSPSKAEFTKMMVHGDAQLRFRARMAESRVPEDAEREFVVSFRLAKDQLSVHEVERPNSGMPGGLFLSYMKVRKPDCNPHCPVYYTAADLLVGAVLNIFGTKFTLHGADDFTLAYFENKPL